MTYLTLNHKAPLDRLFDDFWGFPAASGAPAWSPAADIDEADGHYLLTVDVPGMKRDDIHIEVDGERILVTGERKAEEKRGLYSERRFGKFERAFALPTHVDTTKIEAKYEDGVLSVYVPKAESAKPRQIKIG